MAGLELDSGVVNAGLVETDVSCDEAELEAMMMEDFDRDVDDNDCDCTFFDSIGEGTCSGVSFTSLVIKIAFLRKEPLTSRTCNEK
eukprot:Pgem_evm1s14519